MPRSNRSSLDQGSSFGFLKFSWDSQVTRRTSEFNWVLKLESIWVHLSPMNIHRLMEIVASLSNALAGLPCSECRWPHFAFTRPPLIRYWGNLRRTRMMWIYANVQADLYMFISTVRHASFQGMACLMRFDVVQCNEMQSYVILNTIFMKLQCATDTIISTYDTWCAKH